jgi:integrase
MPGRKGTKPRLVPLINDADENLRWYIEDVLGQFDPDCSQPGLPLFPSERKNADGSSARAAAEVFRRAIANAAERHMPGWSGKLTPHVLRHFCASQLYLQGVKWNLRLAAANRGIWKAGELQRMLAERGMVISAGKMSGLWCAVVCQRTARSPVLQH